MRRAIAVGFALVCLLTPGYVFAQWPEGYIPAGEYQPDQHGGVRAARVVFSNLDQEKGFIAFIAYEFADAEAASAAMPLVEQDYESFIADVWDGDPLLDLASSRTIGDEQLVMAGSIRSDQGNGDVIQQVAAVVRRDNLLWLGTGSRYDDHTPLSDVLDVLERVVERSPNGEAALTEEGWSGGLFAMLPTIQDLPEGYTQTEILRAIGTPEATPPQ